MSDRRAHGRSGVTPPRIVMAALGRAAERGAPDLTGATAPRYHLFDNLFDRRYDLSILDGRVPGPVGRRLPVWARMAAAVHDRRDEYDAVVTWSERLSLSLMTLDRFARGGKPHIPLLYWFSRPSVRVPMKAFGDRLHAIVTWSSVQRRYAIEKLGMPAGKLYLVKHFVDDVFWRSPDPDRETDTIASAGSEMRDYPTLLDALRGTGIPCHVASDHVRVDRFGFARRIEASAFAEAAGGNATIGKLPLVALRDLYARARFVVVPLRPTDTDNGVNVILEAMAMGKPVICSRTQGQVDVIQEGVTGMFVPAGDAEALRKAIVALWNEPARAREMGRAARAYVEKHHALETFCGRVKTALDASLDGRPARADGSF